MQFFYITVFDRFFPIRRRAPRGCRPVRIVPLPRSACRKIHRVIADRGNRHCELIGTGHPTIHSAEQGRSILARFASDFTHPTAREGYDQILYITPTDHPSAMYTRADIATVLQRVRDASPAAQSTRQTPRYTHPGPSFRGNTNRGRRGMWHEGRDRDNHYHRVPRGRGGYSSSTGSSSPFRSWLSPPYRGNSVGIHGTGRETLHHTHTGPRNPANYEQFTSQGKGTGEDPFVID